MAKRIVSDRYRLKQKRLFLFSLVIIYLLITAGMTVVYFSNPTINESMETWLIILLLGLSVLLIWVRQAMVPIQMYLHYLRMIDEQLPPFKINAPIQSKAFESNLTKYQYGIIKDTQWFTLYAREYDRLPWVARTGASVIYLVIIKDQLIEMNDERIEQTIQEHHKKLKKNIQNEMTLLFYQSPSMNPILSEKMNKIINFSIQNRAIITVPAVQLGDEEMYALRPKRLFPNKYYYVLIKLLYYLTEANEML